MIKKLFEKFNFRFSLFGKSIAFILFVLGMIFLSMTLHGLAFISDASAFMVFFFSIISIVSSCAYIYHATGTKTNSDEIHLYFIDRLWTEITSIVVAGLLIIMIFVLINLDEAAVFGYGFFIYPTILIFLASLIRRYKSKTLYENSFLGFMSRIIVISNDALTISQTVSISILIYLFIAFIGFLAALQTSVILFVIWMTLNVLFLSVFGYSLVQIKRLEEATEKFSEAYANDTDELIDSKTVPYYKNIANNINQSEQSFSTAVKDAVQSEQLKAELITNISHDIKTPLTSIISYVNLLSSIKFEDENARKYLLVLDNKSKRLAQLMNDLVDVSKISSGNISVNLENLNFEELMRQSIAEHEDHFKENNIDIIIKTTHSNLFILGDGRHMWRVLDNLLNNAVKYTMPFTRIYIDITHTHEHVFIVMKNISSEPLNMNPRELTDRFVRGDDARTTDGSGLGLSIAESLLKVQYSTMTIDIDGDLFKATLKLNRAFPPMEKMNVVPEFGE